MFFFINNFSLARSLIPYVQISDCLCFYSSAQHIDLTKIEKPRKLKEKSAASYSLPVPKLNSVTIYGEDFYEKCYSKRDPIRTGTSSGLRKNNPHPKKVTIHFKFTSKITHFLPSFFQDQAFSSKLLARFTDFLQDLARSDISCKIRHFLARSSQMPARIMHCLRRSWK